MIWRLLETLRLMNETKCNQTSNNELAIYRMTEV